MGDLRHHGTDEVVEVDRRDVHRRAAQARERQQAIDQLAHVARRVADGGEVARGGLVALQAQVFFQQTHEAGDVPQRRAQVVRDRVGEGLEVAIGRQQLLGALDDALFQLVVDVAHEVVELLRVRHVAVDLGEALEVAALVTQRDQHRVRPVARAVLAQLPALHVVLATRGGQAQHALGIGAASRFIHGVEQHAVVAAEHLHR